MGHSVGISDSYYRPTEHSLREDYLKPVDKLTVTNSQAMIKKFSEPTGITITDGAWSQHEPYPLSPYVR